MEKTLTYSVVIPFYNEEASVGELLRAVTAVMDGLAGSYEILAMNDGSGDGTREELEKIRQINTAVVPVHLPSRGGQTACLAEGFSRAAGRIIISMDGDLQDDPAEIPSMLESFRESGADVVCGWRRGRKEPSLILFISKLGNFFQRMLLRMPVHDISCTFRVYKREAIKAVKLKKEGLHRFLPFLLKRAGFSIAEKEVHPRRRKYGHSKYSPGKAPRTVKLFFEVLTGKY